MPEQMIINVDADNFTLGQAEFLLDYAGVHLTQLIEMIQQDTVHENVRVITALIAIQLEPEHPEAALSRVRQLRIRDLQVG